MDKPPPERNDERALPRDPREVLEMLMMSLGSLVLRTAFFYLGDRHLAEDLSQEVFIRAYKGWQAFRGDSSIRTWLTRITVNLCRDRLRRLGSLEASSRFRANPDRPGPFGTRGPLHSGTQARRG